MKHRLFLKSRIENIGSDEILRIMKKVNRTASTGAGFTPPCPPLR
jgi:hypothetical protein